MSVTLFLCLAMWKLDKTELFLGSIMVELRIKGSISLGGSTLSLLLLQPWLYGWSISRSKFFLLARFFMTFPVERTLVGRNLEMLL